MKDDEYLNFFNINLVFIHHLCYACHQTTNNQLLLTVDILIHHSLRVSSGSSRFYSTPYPDIYCLPIYQAYFIYSNCGFIWSLCTLLWAAILTTFFFINIDPMTISLRLSSVHGDSGYFRTPEPIVQLRTEVLEHALSKLYRFSCLDGEKQGSVQLRPGRYRNFGTSRVSHDLCPRPQLLGWLSSFRVLTLS